MASAHGDICLILGIVCLYEQRQIEACARFERAVDRKAFGYPSEGKTDLANQVRKPRALPPQVVEIPTATSHETVWPPHVAVIGYTTATCSCYCV
jgi:hypothetical protein